jgi:hypothetical protein
MTEVEESVSVSLGFGDIEVGPDKRNEDGVKYEEDEFVKELHTLLEVRQRYFFRLPFG